jgi:hypothetical protein
MSSSSFLGPHKSCKSFRLGEEEKPVERAKQASYDLYAWAVNFFSCIDEIPDPRLINYKLFDTFSSVSGCHFDFGFWISF